MKMIILSESLSAMVDDSDYEYLASLRWYVLEQRNTHYARQMGSRTGMHRLLMGNPQGVVDHIDGNGLNNQRSNLRVCSIQENAFNQRPQQGKSSQYKGVYWHKNHEKWVASIQKNGKKKHLGYFEDEIKAALEYDRAARSLFGEFSRPNFPEVTDQTLCT